jgi:Excalibur calcium-binding domain
MGYRPRCFELARLASVSRRCLDRDKDGIACEKA